jgi:hypothetical protein
MFYAWDITIPKNTLETDPTIEILKLTKGVLTKVDLKFPSGCHGMVKVRIFRSEFQLIPLSHGEWVTGDGESIPTECYYELEETPVQLKFVGCSPDTDYDHTISVRVTVLPKAVATVMPLIEVLTSFLKRIGVIP